MTLPPRANPAVISGREVLTRAKHRYELRAEFGREARAAYGPESFSQMASRDPDLDDGIANVLGVLLTRGAVKLDDLARDKDGKPRFIDKIRWEITNEIVQLVAGALRGAFVKFPDVVESEVSDAA